MAQDKGQHTKRRGRKLPDQHGRMWEFQEDKACGAPVGPINARGWKDRLRTPQKYKVYDEQNSQIRINWAQWETDLKAAHQAWGDVLRRTAISMYGQGASEAIKYPPPELLETVGEKPQPIELILAARRGNKFVLGLSDEMPKWAEPFFAPKVDPFAMTFPDADQEFEDVPVGVGAKTDESWQEPPKRKR